LDLKAGVLRPSSDQAVSIGGLGRVPEGVLCAQMELSGCKQSGAGVYGFSGREGNQAQTRQEGEDTQGTRGAGVERESLHLHQGDQGDRANPRQEGTAISTAGD